MDHDRVAVAFPGRLPMVFERGFLSMLEIRHRFFVLALLKMVLIEQWSEAVGRA